MLCRGPQAALKFKGELQRANNSQLSTAIKVITEVKKHGNHITAMLSYSDLIQLGGYTAVEYCGGPSMLFRMGRKDAKEEPSQKDSLTIVDASHENSV